MERNKYNSIKALIDICWEIRKANREGGDISAGQFINKEFEIILDNATTAFRHTCINN